MPHIFYDGIGEESGRFEDADRICVNVDESVTAGILLGEDGPDVNREYFNCAHASLPEVELATPEEIAEICTPEGDQPNFAALEVNCDSLAAYNSRESLDFIWREDLSDADLTLAGGTRQVSWIHSDGSSRNTNYVIPDANSCKTCHSPGGFASNSALFLEYWREVDTSYGICKTPVAAGAGSGGLRFDIVPGDADASITTYRMNSNEPDVRMPEIGRSVIHEEGVGLIREWINSLHGNCE